MFTQCGIRGIPTTELESTAENKYLAAENRILKAQVKGRLLLSQEKKAALAEIAHRLGRKALEEMEKDLPASLFGLFGVACRRKNSNEVINSY